MSARLLWLLVSLALVPAWAQWTPELQLKVQSVGDVTVSPDGKLVAWTQTRAIIETEKSEMETSLYLAHSDGTARRKLGPGRSPAFSPDGKSLYFERGRAIQKLSVDGGESQPVVDWKGTLGAFRLSPDGKSIAFAGRDTDAAREQARKEKRDFRVVGENPANNTLWVTAADGAGKPRRITDGTKHVGGFSWAPDSMRIAYELRPTPEADDSRLCDIAEVETAAGTIKLIAATRATESQPHYSRDGRYLAFLKSDDPPLAPGDDHIVLFTRASGEARTLSASPDRLPRLLGWSNESRGILFSEGRGTRTALYRMPIDGPPQTIFTPPGVADAVRLNDAGTHLGYVFESSAQAAEAFVRSVAIGEQTRVSAANTELAMPPLGRTDVVWWRSRDNTEIEGLLTYPVGYKPGQKYPLIVLAHGGPYGASTETFIGRAGLYPIATFSSRGYGVLRPNPRASTGYGRDFRYMNLKDWGGGDYNDVITGVDQIIKDKDADPERLAIMGWSYGGYMTAWTITHSTRFKAAAIGAGPENLWSQTGTSDIRANKIDAFGAPWEQLQFYIERSPLSHVAKVTTPTLILHGESDERVPISQGYEMYHALKKRGVDTKMVVYPRTPHGPREPKFVLDIMQRHIDWVEKYVR